MGVKAYVETDGTKKWMADFRLRSPDGREKRVIRRGIPTKEMALRLIQKHQVAAFEGKYFDKKSVSTITIRDVWENYQPRGSMNRSWQTDVGRSVHLLQHLGNRVAVKLTEKDVDEYRQIRSAETTRRGGAPTSATLDKEVELLKRILNYAKRCKKISVNPIADVALIRARNTRDRFIGEVEFARLYQHAEDTLKPILLTAYDTGMRLQEVLGLRWECVNLSERNIRLLPQETKADDQPRIVVLTERLVECLENITKVRTGYVFINPKTGERWNDIRKAFRRAKQLAGIPMDTWFHDSRRAFITNARRRGVDESTVMKMSGHSTRSAFVRYNIVNEDDLRRAVEKIQEGQVVELSKSTGN